MVGIVPKKTTQTPLWLEILFYASIAVLLISLLIYFILNDSMKKSSALLSNLEREITQARTPEKMALEQDILGYQRKIDDFSFFFKSHTSLLNFYSMLENVCHPKVQFTDMRLEPEKSQAVLSGRAENFEAVGQQINIFQQQPFIEKVDLTNLILTEEQGEEFVLTIFIKPELFQFK